METIKERNWRRLKETKEVSLTPIQAKFFNLIIDAALKDEELSKFLIGAATGKTFVIEQIRNALSSSECFNKNNY